MAVQLNGLWLPNPAISANFHHFRTSPPKALASSSSLSSPLTIQRIEVKAATLPRLSFSVRSQVTNNQAVSNSQNGVPGRRRVWRRRKLKTHDRTLKYRMERTPFLEEKVRKIREGGKLIGLDIERLLLSEENRFDFVNEIAAEAIRFVENDPDEYLGKKAVLHALSNRSNDAGIYRPEAYNEPDPYKPGRGYVLDELASGGAPQR